jgi:Tfp pilus assembly protein PilF
LQKAAELEAQEEAGREEFNFGVALYERGRYQESESMLKTALDVAGAISSNLESAQVHCQHE